MKMIKVKDCAVCPYIRFKDSLAKVADKPYCDKTKKILAYTTELRAGERYAVVSLGIDKKCPLENAS